MIVSQGAPGRIFVLRLGDGDTLPGSIETFAREHGVTRALCAALGGLGPGKLVTGPEDGDVMPPTPMLHDIAAIHEAAAIGTLFPDANGAPKLHMHAALGREGKTATGCVRPGLDVWKILEVVVIELTGLDLVRKRDPETGFELLSQA